MAAAALALESPLLVRQKVYAALDSVGSPGVATNRGGSAKQKLWWTVAREFFNQWVTQGNANLQFIPFDETEADAADGTEFLNVAHKVYLFYVKKTGTATTANTVKLYDNIAGDSVTTEQRLSIILSALAQEAMLVYPTGFSMATGLVVTQHTTIEGSTDGSDGGDGFIVVGAA